MDLTLSDEQAMLRESVDRYVRDGTVAREPTTLWASFADLGWLALPLPEDHGGLGGSILDATLLVEAFGRGLLTTPYVSTVIVGAGLIAALGNETQQAVLLPDVAGGGLRLALAHDESGPRGRALPLNTSARSIDGGWRIAGRKVGVVDSADADILLVSAQCDGLTAMFAVPRDAPGVSFIPYTMTGGGDAATVTFEEVFVIREDRLGGDASDAIEAVSDAAITVLCAEAVGIMEALVDATATYTHTRQQFEKPLFANQSVRFKLADMAVAVEEARSLALRSALRLSAPTSERVRAVSGAKAGVARSAKRVTELAIQLHGAMGVTEELAIGGYYKRAVALEAMFGGIDHHLVRHARASGRLAPEGKAA